jgi:hypothetical protein
MPSPTGVTKLVRKKKKTLQGRRRKREERNRTTINFFTAFPVPPQEVKAQPVRKLKKFA